MYRTSSILQATAHRPFVLPTGRWSYYQEWNNSLFLHWKVPPEIVAPLLPEGVAPDVIAGDTWVSVVAFTMEKIRPRNLPHLTAISNFHEINVRAYVNRDNKPGVYFLNIEAQKILSVVLSRSLSGLPYEKATISQSSSNDLYTYTSHNKIKDFHLEAAYRVDDATAYQPTEVDKWLTERYCLYLDKGTHLYRYETHHQEWNLKNVHLEKLSLHYRIGNLEISDRLPDLAHFSAGVKVLAWQKQKL